MRENLKLIAFWVQFWSVIALVGLYGGFISCLCLPIIPLRIVSILGMVLISGYLLYRLFRDID